MCYEACLVYDAGCRFVCTLLGFTEGLGFVWWVGLTIGVLVFGLLVCVCCLVKENQG